MLTFSEPTLQGASREQYPGVYRGIDELLKSEDFPNGSYLHLVPGATDTLEIKLSFMTCTVRNRLENETCRGVQSAARELLTLLASSGHR
jgi:hypothetical protein